MAGYKYIVDHGREGQREFSDLDELIVNHVKAMARKVEELMAHDKYKHETPAQLGMCIYLRFDAPLNLLSSKHLDHVDECNTRSKSLRLWSQS
jgi:hypothetical protein